jgi:hypothetical protein
MFLVPEREAGAGAGKYVEKDAGNTTQFLSLVHTGVLGKQVPGRTLHQVIADA